MTTKTIAFITGANKGIGNEVARQLTQHDFTVLIGARDRDRGEAAAEKLRTANSDVHFVSIDVNDTASIEFAAKTVAEKWGRVDVLINSSKTALNAITVSLAKDLADEIALVSIPFVLVG
jgi:NAD(P)-dependent dehydrogenase (short-subunit alcohol dehydrogenase family)